MHFMTDTKCPLMEYLLGLLCTHTARMNETMAAKSDAAAAAAASAAEEKQPQPQPPTTSFPELPNELLKL